MDQRSMYVIPIRLDVLLNTTQISCCKGKWYMRRFDRDTVKKGHIYSSAKEEEVAIRILGLPRHFLWVRLRTLWSGLTSLAIG